ncbi:MAG: hypothetical protein AABN95_08000 [Acidobacteriota bacterium]
MGKRIGNEARIIALFTALPEDSKRIVADVIRNQTTTRKVKDPKSPASDAGKKSSRKGAGSSSTVNSEGDKGNVSDAKCAICGNEEAYEDHQPNAASYHIFRASLKKKGDKSNGAILPDNPEGFLGGATA